MNRQDALVFVIIFFLIFLALVYYGAKVTLFSSIVFSLLASVILLNIFYPISKVTNDSPDFTLALYAFFEIISILIIAIYVAKETLSSVRTN
jgi:hypothetical membrane protein